MLEVSGVFFLNQNENHFHDDGLRERAVLTSENLQQFSQRKSGGTIMNTRNALFAFK